MKSFYRYEIDGLRGIAVIAMILGHFENPIFVIPAVNIFFVLSGFLITKIIFKENLKFSIINFYKKRIRSLYPQILIVSVITFFVVSFFGNLDYIKEFNRSFLTSILNVFNLYLIKIDNTYTLQDFENPYLPLWAFSVIIQFYIIFPILLKFIFHIFNKLKLNFYCLFFLLLTLTFLTFFIYFINQHEKFGNFYSLGSRAWQFFLGSTLYFYITIFSPKKLASLSGYVGVLSFIIWPFISEQIQNFVFQTIYISLATILLLYSTQTNTIVNTFLKINIYRYLGKISFSLFIVHMPVIFFIGIFFDGITYILISLFLTFILSIILFNINKSIILQKIINFIDANIIKFILIFLIIIFSIISFYTFNKELLLDIEKKYIDGIKKYNFIEKRKNILKSRYDDFDYLPYKLLDNNLQPCHNNENNFTSCYFKSQILSNNNEVDVLAIGGSNVAALGYIAKNELLKKGFNYQQVTIDGCHYLPGFTKYQISTGKEDKFCNSAYQEKLKKTLLKKSNSQKILIIYGRYALYLTSNYFDNQEGGLENGGNWDWSFKGETSISKGLINSMNELENENIKIILIYPIPEVGVNLPKYMLKKFTEINNDNLFTTSYYVFKDRQSEVFATLDKIDNKNLYRIYPHKIFCDNQIKNRCLTHNDKNLFYTDHDHTSIKGSELIVDLILKKIEEIK